MGIKSRRLKTLEVKLKAVLEAAAAELPESDVRTWGHEVGRANNIHGYCAGIECRDLVLNVVVLGLHLFPELTSYIIGPKGGHYRGGFDGRSLTCLSQLPEMIELYRGYLETNQEEPVREFLFGAPPTPLETVSASSEERELLSQILPGLIRERGLDDWVLNSRTCSPREEPGWPALALPYLREKLPTLELEALQSHSHPENEAELGALEGVPVFCSPESRSRLRWCEFYGQYPDAGGLLEISRPRLQGTQALLRLRGERGFHRKDYTNYQSWDGPQLGGEGPFPELLLLEKTDSWKVVASFDLNEPCPMEILGELQRREWAPTVETPEGAAELGVDQVRVDKIWISNYSCGWRRVDVTVTKGGQSLKVGAFSGLFYLLRDKPMVIDRLLVQAESFHPEGIWETLAGFLKEIGFVT